MPSLPKTADLTAQCIIAKVLATNPYRGAWTPEEAVQASISSPDALAKYADLTNRTAQELEKFVLDNRVELAKGIGDYTPIERATRIPIKSLSHFVRSPEAIVGREVVQQVEQAIARHIEATGGKDLGAWRSEVVPELQSIFDSHIDTLKNQSPLAANYFQDYINFQIQGGRVYNSLFNPTGAWSKPIHEISDNVARFLVDQNPMIAAYNVLEFTPKALYYAIERDGVAGLGKVLKGMAEYGKAAQGKHWIGRVPELERKGVYGLGGEQANIFTRLGLPVNSVIDITENPLRGMSYYIGEAIQPGGGLDAVEKIAYAPRFGNEPMMLWTRENRMTISLMRFGIASMKMYAQAGKQILTGDLDTRLKTTGGMAALLATMAVQTGSKSVIPGWLYSQMPEDQKEGLEAIDDAYGLNLVGRATGLDLANTQQPLQPPALGLTQSLITSSFKGATTGAGKVISGTMEGDVLKAGFGLADTAFALAPLGKVPYVNMTSARLYRAMRDAVMQDADLMDELKQEFNVQSDE